MNKRILLKSAVLIFLAGAANVASAQSHEIEYGEDTCTIVYTQADVDLSNEYLRAPAELAITRLQEMFPAEAADIEGVFLWRQSMARPTLPTDVQQMADRISAAAEAKSTGLGFQVLYTIYRAGGDYELYRSNLSNPSIVPGEESVLNRRDLNRLTPLPKIIYPSAYDPDPTPASSGGMYEINREVYDLKLWKYHEYGRAENAALSTCINHLSGKEPQPTTPAEAPVVPDNPTVPENPVIPENNATTHESSDDC
ncbi:hypothetical protein [Corynebacterium sp. A21]|uniref:hypothetical protein n=1 Tax=Corynebacterium sp. A21 TaxID=3457318 RepID=UPI003FD1F60C